MDEYKEIEYLYGSSLLTATPDVLLITKKWENSDYVYPFSDIDYRITVKDYVDLWKLNECLYSVHFKCAINISYGTRILEHPAGFLYFEKELKKISVYHDDFSKTSFSFGNDNLFLQVKESIAFYKPNIYHLYEYFFKRYHRFSLRYEYDGFQNEMNKKYKKYCVLWHYYIPCMYALRCLKDCIVYNYKINYDWYDKQLLDLIYAFQTGEEPKETLDELIKIVNETLKKELNMQFFELPIIKSTISNEKIFMLRTRIARIIYYLNPPKQCDTLYLQERECKELLPIFLFCQKHYKSPIWNKLIDLLQLKTLSASNKLEQVMQSIYKEKAFLTQVMMLEGSIK